MGNVPPVLLDQRVFCGNERGKERRSRERVRICLPVHIRSIVPTQRQIEEATTTLDMGRHGLCFRTSRDHYRLGMSLSLTFPYSPPVMVRKEFVGDVVRVESLSSGGWSVAVQFLSHPEPEARE